MFDLSFGELAVIGTVALVVLGPERLPKVARTVGDWVGKAQRYVNQVKSDINREMELAELKKLQEEARQAAQSVQSSVQNLQTDLSKATSEIEGALSTSSSTLPSTSGTNGGIDPAAGAGAYAWEGAGETWANTRFARRYRPGPSVDELAEEIARLRRQMALPSTQSGGYRRKFTPRARVNRPRIHR
jgi:sec-independent protein translocase protein TatB